LSHELSETGAPISRNSSKPIAYESQTGFYEASYADTIVGKLSLVESAMMVHCEQRAGDWSDAPTPDLVISVIESGRGEHGVDLGAGRFRGRFRSGQALVIAPATGSSLERDARHSLWGLNLRYSWLREFAGEGLELPASGDFGRLHASPIEDELLVTLHRSFRKFPAREPERLFTDCGILLLADVVGAIGVGVAPGGDKDEACALAGAAAIADRLKP
jgi:hypothetical protein